MRHDYHAHTNYSDGRPIYEMVEAAAEAGLDGLGLTDHCNVSARAKPAEAKAIHGHNLDITYERRRRAIESIRERADIEIYDAVEMDYHPADEAEIRSFLDEAGFDYALGSVHEVDGTNVHFESYFAEKSEAEREEAVSTYFDRLVSLIDSELFEIAAHVDLIERNPALRGLATEAEYRAVAEAFADSRTVPEINAGRILGQYGEFHPRSDLLDVLMEAGTEFTVGTDSHTPEEFAPRLTEIEALLDEYGIEPIELEIETETAGPAFR